jgi:hypothetical protein
MKSKLLLVISVICIVSALIIGLILPVFADAGGAISISPELNTITTLDPVELTITIKNNNTDGHSITLQELTVTVFHKGQTNLPQDLHPNNVIIAAGGSKDFSFTLIPLATDITTPPSKLYLYVAAKGIDNTLYDPNIPELAYTVSMGWPTSTGPITPELPAGILLGIGALGLGGFILVRRKESSVKA